jgi:hypothetical protein
MTSCTMKPMAMATVAARYVPLLVTTVARAM